MICDHPPHCTVVDRSRTSINRGIGWGMDWELDPAEFAAILEEFRANTTELLRVLSTQLLRLERNPHDGSPVREMFLCAHTIKGGAAMLGLDAIREVTHAMEDVLGVLRDGGRFLEPGLTDLLFRTLDVVRDLLNNTGDAAPLSITEVQVTEELRAWVANPPPAPLHNERPHVLLVEDSATVRALEVMVLSGAGFEVDAVRDGQEALVMAQTRQYEVVVSGAETRGLRGIELASALRRLPSTVSVPFILLSSDESLDHRQRAAAAGVDAVVSRGTYNHHPLLEVIQVLINRVKR